MFDVSQEFRNALDSGTLQHIRGRLTLKNNIVVELTESEIKAPSYSHQCTSDTDNFMFGQMYTGTLEFTLLDNTYRREELRGGTVTLEFGLEGFTEWVPLGVWNITEPQRGSNGGILIKCIDNTAKLDVPIPYKTPAWYTMESRMQIVSNLTGLAFAQTIEELSELAGTEIDDLTYGTKLYSDCRSEVRAIAEFIGGFSYIDRMGRIAFARFGANEFVPEIPASRRFSANLSEYSYCVVGVRYVTVHDTLRTDDLVRSANTKVSLAFTDNEYLWDEDEDSNIMSKLERIRDNLAGAGIWIPGSIEYAGDPTIDLGDKLLLTGGVNGNTPTAFIVTADTWQFRGPQTLISAGITAEQTVYSSSSGSSSEGGSSYTSASLQAQTVSSINTVYLDTDDEAELEDVLTEIAEGEFMSSSSQDCFFQMTALVTASDGTEAEFHMLLDGIMQDVFVIQSLAQDETRTIELTVPLRCVRGEHTVTVEAKGRAEILRMKAYVWGQDIAETDGVMTYDGDYRYHENTVDEYIGTTLTPHIPPKLGGNDVHIIGGGSFTYAEVVSTVIPDGAEEIE